MTNFPPLATWLRKFAGLDASAQREAAATSSYQQLLCTCLSFGEKALEGTERAAVRPDQTVVKQ